jgi:LPS O-antigen subunit length determinant protein (WzzB/FepE family)
MQRCIAIAERMSEVKANVTQALQKNAMHEADETFRARCLRLLEAREQLTPEIAKSALRCVLPLCQLVGARFLRDVPVMTRLACEQPSVSRAALEDLIAWKMMPPLEKLLGAFALEHSLEWQKQVLVDVELRGELRHLAQLQTATRNVSRELRGHVARASRAIRDRAPAGAGELSLSEDRAGALSKD